MATFHPLPTDGSRAPMTASRQNLAGAIAALADEIESHGETMRPAQRLGQLSTDLAELDRELASLKDVHETRLGDWIAGGQEGERPQPSLRISTLEPRRRLLASDAEAVERVAPKPNRRSTPGARTARPRRRRRVPGPRRALPSAVEVLRPMLSQERLAEQLQEIRDGLAELATREADLQRREQRILKIEAALGNLLEVGEVALFRILH